MTADSVGLPEFRNPPVVEVALSIRFKPLKLTAPHIGLLWERFRSEFPTIEDQIPLEVPIETEKERVSPQFAAMGGQLKVLKVPRVRSWFVSASGTQLIQVQHDFLAHNWRRNDTDETYPRFNTVRESFERELQVFAKFISEYQLGTPEPVQCEVTYVNHIFAGRTWQRHDEIHKVFRIWASPKQEFLPTADDGRFLVRYVMRDANGSFCGRLHVSSQPAFADSNGTERLLLATTLTARGRPIGSGLAGALEFLNLGHVWIVRGFADLTTPAMHEEWGRSR